MTSDLRVHTYTSLNKSIHFHYGDKWVKYDNDAYNETYNRLNHLDLAF